MISTKLCKALETRIETCLEQAKNVHSDPSPDTIHDFRVASRYLLAIEPLLRSTSDTEPWRKNLKRWLKSLTYLRDLHVFRLRFSNNPELATLVDDNIEHELNHCAEIRRHTGGGDFANQLHDSYHTFCVSKHKKADIETLVSSLWMKHWDTLNQKLQAIDYDKPASIHKLRISFKPFRYTASFLHESALVHISNFNEFKYWQDIMGEINDLEVVSDWLKDKTGYENLIIQLDNEATTLRHRLMSEEPTFRRFIQNIHQDVRTKLND